MREISATEAKCDACGQSFGYPYLGDFAYGEAVLCTSDGKEFALVNALEEFPRRVADLLGQSPGLWSALAALADPIGGKALSATIHCPHCGLEKPASWDGPVVGKAYVPLATFNAAATLPPDVLATRLKGPEYEA